MEDERPQTTSATYPSNDQTERYNDAQKAKAAYAGTAHGLVTGETNSTVEANLFALENEIAKLDDLVNIFTKKIQILMPETVDSRETVDSAEKSLSSNSGLATLIRDRYYGVRSIRRRVETLMSSVDL